MRFDMHASKLQHIPDFHTASAMAGSLVFDTSVTAVNQQFPKEKAAPSTGRAVNTMQLTTYITLPHGSIPQV